MIHANMLVCECVFEQVFIIYSVSVFGRRNWQMSIWSTFIDLGYCGKVLLYTRFQHFWRMYVHNTRHYCLCVYCCGGSSTSEWTISHATTPLCCFFENEALVNKTPRKSKFTPPINNSHLSRKTGPSRCKIRRQSRYCRCSSRHKNLACDTAYCLPPKMC